MLKKTAFILALCLMGHTLAQGIETDFRLWFGNPIIFITAIVVIVRFVRDAVPEINGKAYVGALTLLVGLLTGIAGQFLQLLSVEPFATMSFPYGGLGYGFAAGLSAFLGVNVFDILAYRAGEQRAKALTEHAEPIPRNFHIEVVDKVDSISLAKQVATRITAEMDARAGRG